MSVKLALTGTLTALAIGAASVAGLALSQDEPVRTVSATVVPASQGQDLDGPHSMGMAGPLGGHLDDVLADLPDELRADLEEAWQSGDLGERLDALAAVHDRAADGRYGTEVQDKVDRLDSELPTQSELQQLAADHLDTLPIEVPAELRQELVRAAGNGDAGDRLAALADVHDRALAGDLGPQARMLVEQLGRFLEQMDAGGGFPGAGGLGA
ncbi:hypothetical protein [uncultured Nocardioides sp.]|uniref:hypothetical protein n=1 Tax=uncultured Nocardioides sp. TaxID=198441 RepID=UPI002631E8E6|nr:hypothetical protein [uncultured Nocardioides sp.]